MGRFVKKCSPLFIISMVFLLPFLDMPTLQAREETFYTANKTCKVRSGPGTNYPIIKSGTDDVRVYNNTELEYINTKIGPVNSSMETWYGVKFDYAAKEYTGYVWDNCVKIKVRSYNDDAAFEELLNLQNFPESYKPYLRRLHALHPNWVFKADNNNLSWNDSVTAESSIGTSAVSNLYPSLFFINSIYPNGHIVDGTSWYAPCYDAVAYYMDPRNFLSGNTVFMFEKLSYDATQSESLVAAILSDTFMNGTFKENGVDRTYTSAFIQAAAKENVSATLLAARAKQEMGSTMGSAASGTTPGYEGYYNFFNIGATSGVDNYIKGLQYAKSVGWDSVQKSITGGAKFLGDKYIKKGQDTLYFQKYNVSKDRQYNTYTHQYMTNIMAPRSEAKSIYNSYSDKGAIDNAYVFTIPVYRTMTDTAYKVARNDTIGGSSDPGENPGTITPSVKVASAGYSLATGYLTGIRYATDISTVKQALVNAGASAGILNSAWNSKTSGSIATGDIITVDNAQYISVIYGDIAGDGMIGIKDLLLVQKKLLGAQNLSGAYEKAADVSKDGAITIKDLLLIQKYLLGTGSISQ
ncbi:MAG: dockerin type I domain-containing protein [Bacilli bacterium]